MMIRMSVPKPMYTAFSFYRESMGYVPCGPLSQTSRVSTPGQANIGHSTGPDSSYGTDLEYESSQMGTTWQPSVGGRERVLL